MKLAKKTREKIAIVILIGGGIAFCIGGIWFPPLLAMGGPMIAGGLAILSNYLQDKDRFTINHNYGDIETPRMTHTDIVRATPKQKLSALFAFKNSKYSMHGEKSEDIKKNTHEHVSADKDVIKEIQEINDLINSMGFKELKDCADKYSAPQEEEMMPVVKCAGQYNVAQEEEILSIDKHESPRI